ncbi:aspartic protease/reverse transcriptase [Cassava vein mosaic virus]|uniref:Putative enzymatic polyprotein n=1 Tax=Cassava vein mosaic virus TaxID=38062 RepID=POL_CSVMV|nr:aspartic protease/reverse transcriptase [Cassava vein mosaic virus]Q89703.1 RecName: Full=Putative enzymatic polyprotein; Includes: RecName: Full=Protease; Short=PR; Includes: RecName: Full=Reverse transcriptase; Short=RT; Includes: RecName: Full=Ribonuclease H [Cassava vein mosaic virus]AAA79873.1 ORF III [Cassava vein mosaic virus]AAB03327.1 ORF 3 [Cassava vein mosaic virus]
MNKITYMTIKISIPKYMSRIYHGLFDTGANICICKKKVLPDELWHKTENLVLRGFNDEKHVAEYRADNITIMIAKEKFIIPYIYAMDEMSPDIIIGATFYNKYSPIELDIGKGIIKFTKNNEKYPNYLVKYPKKRKLVPWTKGNPSVTETMENIGINQIESRNPIEEEINQILGTDIYGENPLEKWEKHKTLAKIELKNETDNIYKPPMLYQETDLPEFKMHIEEMIKEGFIEEKTNFEDKKYSSPAFIVNKHSEQKRGKTRMVIDYKDLNKKAKVVKYPIPNKDTLIHRSIQARYYSKFDCKSGFYHIKLEEDSKKYTAFTVPQGYYQWKVLPFGYHNSPSIFQQFMDRIFRPYYDFIIVYIDDILVFSKTIEEHKIHIAKFRDITLANGLIISKKKTELCKEKIDFLGVQIEQGGIELQPHIINKILEKHTKIKNKTELQSILGLLNQIRHFIPHLAQILLPIQKKLKIKDEEIWTWTKEDEEKIKLIQDYSKNLVIKMKYPINKEDMNWIIEVDASNNAYGSCLKYKPKNSKIEYLCRYNSGTFKENEQKYDINRKELIAVYQGLQSYSLFTCEGNKLVRTDNSQVYYWIKNDTNKKSIEFRNIKYLLAKIAVYNFEIQLIDGKTNIIADYLSRYNSSDTDGRYDEANT